MHEADTGRLRLSRRRRSQASRSGSSSSPGAINCRSTSAYGSIVWLRSSAATFCFGFETDARSYALPATCSHLRASDSGLSTIRFENALLS